MPQRKDPLIPGEYYHIYNRGINSEIVFRTARNYYFFLRRFNEFFIPQSASVIAYALMPTHYHLLVQNTNKNFSLAMGRLSNSYTKAFNNEWGRTGPLFEGRFKAKWVDSDEYVLELSRYIHLNPVSAEFVDKPEKWPYSSYSSLIGEKESELPLTNLIHSYFEYVDPKIGYQNFVEEGIGIIEKSPLHLRFD